MTTKYRVVKWRFNMQKFAAVMGTVGAEDIRVFAEVIGVHHSTLRNWQNEGAVGKYLQPAMGSFLSACNALDLDPRDFFELEE